MSNNPYVSPQPVDDDASVIRDIAESTAPERMVFRWALFVVATAVAIGFVVFTVVLLQSTAGDRKAGLCFCLNVPCAVLAPLMIALQSPKTYRWTLAATVGQAAVTLLMIILGIGDIEIVLAINGGILAAFGAVLTFDWWSSRRLSRFASEKKELLVGA